MTGEKLGINLISTSQTLIHTLHIGIRKNSRTVLTYLQSEKSLCTRAQYGHLRSSNRLGLRYVELKVEVYKEKPISYLVLFSLST